MSEDILTVGEVAEEFGVHRKKAMRAMDEARERWGVGRKDPVSGWRMVRREELGRVRQALKQREERNPAPRGGGC